MATVGSTFSRRRWWRRSSSLASTACVRCVATALARQPRPASLHKQDMVILQETRADLLLASCSNALMEIDCQEVKFAFCRYGRCPACGLLKAFMHVHLADKMSVRNKDRSMHVVLSLGRVMDVGHVLKVCSSPQASPTPRKSRRGGRNAEDAVQRQRHGRRCRF